MITLEIDDLMSSELADTVSYNNGSTSSDVSGIVDYWSDGAKPGDQATILVKKSEVSSPDYRQTFTIDGSVWYITPPSKDKDFILAQDELTFLLAISKNQRFKQWRT